MISFAITFNFTKFPFLAIGRAAADWLAHPFVSIKWMGMAGADNDDSQKYSRKEMDLLREPPEVYESQ